MATGKIVWRVVYRNMMRGRSVVYIKTEDTQMDSMLNIVKKKYPNINKIQEVKCWVNESTTLM